MSDSKIIIIGGATASGKSSLAVKLALDKDAVIINADSMQLYKELPIITAQPTAQEQQVISHKLYGTIQASEHCSVAKWINLARIEINEALAANKTPILVGGTGMYIKSLIDGLSEIPDISDEIKQFSTKLMEKIGAEEFHKKLSEIDPIIANRLPTSDRQRMIRAYNVHQQTGITLSDWQKKPNKIFYPKESFKGIFLNIEREKLYDNCNKRFLKMLDEGALREVEQLMKQNLNPNLPACKALGVPEITTYLTGEYEKEEMIEKAQTATRQYAKRQLTWFKNQFADWEVVDS